MVCGSRAGLGKGRQDGLRVKTEASMHVGGTHQHRTEMTTALLCTLDESETLHFGGHPAAGLHTHLSWGLPAVSKRCSTPLQCSTALGIDTEALGIDTVSCDKIDAESRNTTLDFVIHLHREGVGPLPSLSGLHNI